MVAVAVVCCVLLTVSSIQCAVAGLITIIPVMYAYTVQIEEWHHLEGPSTMKMDEIDYCIRPRSNGRGRVMLILSSIATWEREECETREISQFRNRLRATLECYPANEEVFNTCLDNDERE